MIEEGHSNVERGIQHLFNIEEGHLIPIRGSFNCGGRGIQLEGIRYIIPIYLIKIFKMRVVKFLNKIFGLDNNSFSNV